MNTLIPNEVKIALLGFAIIMLALGITGDADHQESIIAERHYCEMVAMYDRTGGGNGWPPYKGREICE